MSSTFSLLENRLIIVNFDQKVRDCIFPYPGRKRENFDENCWQNS